MSSIGPALLDTSIYVALESGRRIDIDAIPQDVTTTVITLAELQAGVLAATDTATRAGRLATYEAAAGVDVLPVTMEAARHWAALRVRLAEEGRSAKINDLWIASIALANGMDVVTQDTDFDVVELVGGPRVVRA